MTSFAPLNHESRLTCERCHGHGYVRTELGRQAGIDKLFAILRAKIDYGNKAPAGMSDEQIEAIWNTLGYRTKFSNYMLTFARAILDAASPDTWKVLPSQAAPWVRCTDELPEEWTEVLVTGKATNGSPLGVCMGILKDGDFYFAGADGGCNPCITSNVTHWMPLPAAPTGEPIQELKELTKEEGK